jgi:hypothetical protein
MGTRPSEFIAAIGAGALAIAAGEVWFRGLVHGLLVPDFSVQRPRGAWFLSRAAFTSSIAYAAVATVMAMAALEYPLVRRFGASEFELVLGAATVFFAVGVSLAILRERSMSFLPGLAIQILGLVSGAVIGTLLL